MSLQTGRAARAVDLIGKAIALNPDFATAYSNRGLALQAMNRIEEALASYDNAIMLVPDYADAHCNRGLALESLKRPVEALASYGTAIALRPDYAAAYNNRGNVLQSLERLTEAITSYDKAIALMPGYAEAHYNRGNALRTMQRPDDAVASYDRAIALQPDHAAAFSNRGLALQALGRPDEAVASYDKSIATQRDFAEAYNNRGTALQALKRGAEALADYDRAIALKPDYTEAHNNRGTVLQLLKRPDEAATSYDRAIALRPDHAEAYNNRGTALQDMQRSEEALASYDKAIAMRPDYAEAYNNKSLCLLRMGCFDHGWPLYEWRKRRDEPVGARSYRQPVWLGEPDIAGKHVFVHWEQGLGDTLQFCRYANLVEARGAKVVMEVQQPLVRLLKRNFPTVDVIGPHQVQSDFDYHCPLLSLPLALGTEVETIPSQQRYFCADKAQRMQWAARLPAKTRPRIGLAWSGSTIYKNDYSRSTGLETYLPLLGPEAEWICIQKEIRQGDLAVLRQVGDIAFLAMICMTSPRRLHWWICWTW